MANPAYSDPIDVDFTEFDAQYNTGNNSSSSFGKSQGSGSKAQYQDNIRKQIECLDLELYPFGFTFFDISKSSPRKSKDKYNCADAIRTLIDNQQLMGTMLQKGYLPIRLLSKSSHVSSKAIEAHEGYIVMASLVLTGNYPDLQSYFDYVFDED